MKRTVRWNSGLDIERRSSKVHGRLPIVIGTTVHGRVVLSDSFELRGLDRKKIRVRELVKIVPAVILIAAGIFVSGCHKKLVPTDPVPPHLSATEISPSKYHVWVRGKVIHKRGKYHWKNGRYRGQSATQPVYVAGHWKHTLFGHRWVKGRWKKF